MKLETFIENEFLNIYTSLKEQDKNDKKLIFQTINNANEDIKSVLNNLELKHINIPLSVAELITNINNISFNKIINLTKSLEEIILFAISSPFIDINRIEDVEEKYVSKLNSDYYDLRKVNFMYDNIFKTYIYEIATANKLKNDIDKYNVVLKLINNKQNEIIANMEKIISDKKKNATLCFDKNISILIKNVDKHNTKINKTNINLIKDFVSNKINENNIILINKNLKLLHDSIVKNIDKTSSLLLNSRKNDKQEIKENNLVLKEYLLNYTNGLFDKISKQSRKLVDIIYLDKKSIEDEIAKYDNLLSKIMIVEYNFDKQFTSYKKNIIKNKQIFTTNKVIDLVNENVKSLENIITSQIKESVINVLKNELLYVNQTLIKYNQAIEKINTKTNILSDKEVYNLFK